MSVKSVSVHAKWIVGKVIGTKMQKTAKVRVTRLVLDQYLLKGLIKLVLKPGMGETAMQLIGLSAASHSVTVFSLQYYNKRKTYFAHDPLEQCTVGDVVLLKALPERRAKHVTHELAEIVYKVGNVIDPLTGKQVAGSLFQETLTDSMENPAGSLTEKLQELNISAATSEILQKPSEV
ncbi:UNVERIFIED_CONTAM: hypothetical protein FKN15_036470 [Acipenser sinensis]